MCQTDTHVYEKKYVTKSKQQMGLERFKTWIIKKYTEFDKYILKGGKSCIYQC